MEAEREEDEGKNKGGQPRRAGGGGGGPAGRAVYNGVAEVTVAGVRGGLALARGQWTAGGPPEAPPLKLALRRVSPPAQEPSSGSSSGVNRSSHILRRCKPPRSPAPSSTGWKVRQEFMRPP